jgi:uncharacterized protein
MRFLRLLPLLLALGLSGASWAAEVLPPPPAAYCNDAAGVLSRATVARLNAQLADYERRTSNQIVVAIYPKMASDSSVEDYTVRLAQSWHVGQKGKDNGAVLFVFVADHKMYIQVGYGLEGALPDIAAKRIIAGEVAPRFRQGDYDGGISAGVAAMMAATQGEYKGTGATVAGGRDQTAGRFSVGILIFLFLVVGAIRLFAGGSRVYGSTGFYGGGWGGGFGGGSGFGGGGGGGFSGGGGSFGGGGAGGSW